LPLALLRLLFLLLTRPPPTSTLFPYTTLFRSDQTIRMALAGIDIATFTDPTDTNNEYRIRLSVPRDPYPDMSVFDNLYVNTVGRSEEHTSELQSRENLVCRLLLEKKKKQA